MQFFKIVLNFILIWLLGTSVFVFSYNAMLDGEAPVSMPFISLDLDDWEPGFVELKGTWVGLEETLYDKNNTAVVTCLKSESLCVERRASIPSTSLSPSSRLLRMETYQYPIISWSNDIIVFGDNKNCANTIYSINRHSEEVTFKRGLKTTSKKSCDGFSTNFSGKLIDGFTAYQNFQTEARNKFILSPRFTLLLWTIFVLAWSMFLRKGTKID